MRVLLFTDLYPDGTSRQGGDQTQAVKELYENAKPHGLSLVAVVRLQQIIRKKFSVRWFLPRKNGEIIDVPVVGFRTFFLKLLTRKLVERQLARRDYDVLVCHLSLCALQVKMLKFGEGKPKVLVVHRSDLNYRYLSECIDYFDLVCARSHAIKVELEARFNLCNVPVVYSGIPGYFFKPIGSEVSHFSNKQPLRLIYAGELKALKNIDAVIKSIPILLNEGLDVRFQIFGEGPEFDKLKNMVATQGLEEIVSFHGWVERTELTQHLSKAHMFVMPSKPETFGLVYLEAMAMGLAILGHKGEGIDGVVEDGESALMVNSADEHSIAGKIIRFYNLGKSERGKMIRAGRAIAENYRLESAARNYFETLKSAK